MLESLLTHKGLPQEAVHLNFRKMFDNILTPYMVMDRRFYIVYANPAYLEMVERKLEDIIGRYVFDNFPDTEERVEIIRSAMVRTLNGETTRMERQSYHFESADGSTRTRCWQCVQTPYFNSDGEVAYIIHHAEDVAEAVELERRNQLIARELDHRVKNMFSVIQATASLASQNVTDISEFRDSFISRLMAMSRSYNQLRNSNWEGVPLRDIFEAELEQYGGLNSNRITAEGPHVLFNAKVVQTASIFVHELATNAAKYGCFSTPEGRLHISWWHEEGGPGMFISWTETGLSGVTAPETTGFGTQLSDFMPNMKIKRDYRDEGLHVDVYLPMTLARQSEPKKRIVA